MIPKYDKIHNRFQFNGYHYGRANLSDVAYSYVKEGDPFEKSIGNFLLDWVDDKDYVEVKTSGSTGTSKIIKLKKQAMVHSAIATGDHFKLKPGDTALHCLSTDFIAGKMMLVRAMILGLEIEVVAPSSHPFIDIDAHYDFCAMVPMQVENSLKELNQINKLIIGGASVSVKLIEKLQNVKTKVYATYGMTETITHIAVSPLNHQKDSDKSTLAKPIFKSLPDVSLSQDKRNCLVIEAPQLFDGKVVTNDIVTLISESTFKFLGRHDNMINSGGIKLFPEQIEAKLSNVINQRFFIASRADELLGEKVVLIVEGDSSIFDKSVFDVLDSYEKPKNIFNITKFSETASGKINRKETLKLLK